MSEKQTIYSIYIEVSPFPMFHATTQPFKSSAAAMQEALKLAYNFYQRYEGTHGLLTKEESDAEFALLHPESAADEVEKLDYYYTQIVDSITISIFPEGTEE